MTGSEHRRGSRVGVEHLTADAFAPFGQVLTPTGAGAQRHEFAARLENRRPVDGEPDAGRLLVFVAEGWQAVNYDAGVWHAPMRALGDPGAFVMPRWDGWERGRHGVLATSSLDRGRVAGVRVSLLQQTVRLMAAVGLCWPGSPAARTRVQE